MIKIFESTATDFKSNGIKTIKPIKAVETKKQSLNGWELDVVVSLEHKDLIQQDMIVTAKVKGSINPQAFRIQNPTYTKKTIEFKAHHVIFDSGYLLIEDTRPTKVNAATALQDLNRNTVDKSPFTFTSNVGGSNTAYILNKSLLEAMDTVQQRWGGKYVIDNFNVALQINPGYDNGEVISYGKNLEDIKVFEDWSGVVTKLKPRGFDGITLPEVFILGDVEYEKPYTKTIKFETEIEEEDRTEELLITELRDLATKYVTDNQYPKVSYEVKSDINQNLDIYDTVTVKHPIVILTTEVQEYEYDINTKRVKKLVFGNYDRDVKKRFDQIKDDIQKNKEQMSDFEAIVFEQTDLINSMNKYGHVYVDDNQIMILDKLPKENAKNVWRWNMGGLGFSKNGIEGPFETAWTIDGTFNANFIGAYAIKANQLASDVGASLDLSSNTSINLMVKDIETKIENIELTPGPKGDKGDTGEQGIPGQKGQDGKTTFTWIKYADTPTSGMSDLPTNKKYMGIAVNKDTATESSNYSDYTWSKVEGEQGIPGTPGSDGKPTYTWVRYSDTPTTGISTSPEGKKYIGLAFNKNTGSASNTYSDYAWSLMPQNITVGGRNLILDSKGDFTVLPRDTGGPGDNYNYYTLKFERFTRFKVGDTYTLCGDIEVTHGNFSTISIYGGYPGGKLARVDIIDGKFILTFTLTSETANSILIYAGIAGSTRGNGMILRNLKLERGDTPTDWTPAPEDIDDWISDVEGKTDANIETTQENSAAIQINSNSIANEVSERVMQGEKIMSDVEAMQELTARDLTLQFSEWLEDKASNEDIEAITTYFRWDINGAIIGKSGSPVEFYQTNDKIGFRENGITISEWERGTQTVDNLIARISIVIGKHLVSTYDSPAIGKSTLIQMVE